MSNFAYISLDIDLLSRVITKSTSFKECWAALVSWASRANTFLEQARFPQPVVWSLLEDGNVGCFLLDESCITDEGPYPRPICGHITSSGLVCTNGRGYKTGHSGFGICSFCEKKTEGALKIHRNHANASLKPLSDSNRRMHLLNRQNQVPSRLAECLVAAEAIESTHLRSLEGDIQVLYGIIQYVFEGGVQDISDEDRQSGNWKLGFGEFRLLNMLFKTLLEAKKTRHSMENELRLDPVTIKAFVSQVLAIVFSNTDARMARKIGAEILDRVIRPFRTQGKLTGADEEYESVGGAMVDAISKFSGVAPEEIVGLEREEVPSREHIKDGTAIVQELRGRVAGLTEAARRTDFSTTSVQRRSRERKRLREIST